VHNRIVAQLENFRLKVFRVVAEHLNFHKAAEQLFLTEPAAAEQIEAVESEPGEPLFDRTGGKVSLTRQGSILPTYTHEVATMVFDPGNSSISPPLGRYPRVGKVIDKRGGRGDLPE
jgi:Bacterial regulatory helix-turn-helix protein, lysR family